MRVAARDDHQPELRRCQPDERIHLACQIAMTDLVEVVEDQHHGLAVGCDRVRDHKGRIPWKSDLGDQADGLLERRRDQAPEDSGVVVVAVQEHPRHRAGRPAALHPGGHEKRLAGAGRTCDEREPVRRPPGQLPVEALAGHQVVRQ